MSGVVKLDRFSDVAYLTLNVPKERLKVTMIIISEWRNRQ